MNRLWKNMFRVSKKVSIYTFLVIFSYGFRTAKSQQDIEDFNINEENNEYILVATSTENMKIHKSYAQCVPCDCSIAKGCDGCKYEWDLQLGRSTWRVKLTNKRRIIIRPSNGSVTEGTWKCRDTTSSNGGWKHAHIFENENGYLIHQIYLAESCEQIANVNIECKKTNDGPKYIAVNKSLDYEAAKKHCSQRYENGSLRSFKNESELWGNFTGLMSEDYSYCFLYIAGNVSCMKRNGSRTTSSTTAEGRFICQVNKDYAMKGIIIDVAVRHRTGINKIWIDADNSETISTEAKRFVLPEDTKSVTIEARCLSHGWCWILASLSNGIVTNESWICADSRCCDDSPWNCSHQLQWKKATIISGTSTRDELEGIASNAKWIWLDDSSTKNVYCRRNFDTDENKIHVNMTIDDKGTLTTDTGEVYTDNKNWRKAESFTLPGNTKYVIIKALNDPGNVGGILASFSNGVVTDESWECADMWSHDSGNCERKPVWHNATEYGPNNKTTSPWGIIVNKAISGIEPRAQWIWVTSAYAESVWCKKTFSK